jgi:hypothetical protein
LIYIAGGNGDDKNKYVAAMKEIKEKKIKPTEGVQEDQLYTDDYAFIKGYEYEHTGKIGFQKP